MTSWSGFGAARARSSWGLLVTLLALVTVTSAIIAGTVGYSQAAASTAARAALTQGEPTETGVQVQTRLAEEPQEQDTRARATITDAFAPAPVSIGRLVVSEPRPVSAAGSELDGDLVVMGGPDLAVGQTPDELVTLLDGAWPQTGGEGSTDAPAQGALHVGAAQAWGVEVGDVLVVEDRAVEIAATWQPVRADDAFWFGDELTRTGVTDEESTRGPLVVDEGLAQQVGAPFVRWPVRPESAQIQPDDLAVLAAGAENLRFDLREAEGVAVRGVQVEGDLAPTAAQASTNLATARALGVIPLSVLVLVTGLAVVQLARLLAATREPQAQLLVARGASRQQVLLTGLLESVVVAAVGTVLGAGLAWAVMQAVPGGEELLGRLVLTALTTLVGISLALAVIAALQARRLSGGEAVADRSGRARAATTIAVVVVVLAAAALSWWQLRRAGSPLTRAEDGTLGTDLVAGAAPALLLAASAVAAMALLGPLTRLLEVATRPSRTATHHLASAQVSRHLQVYAVPVVLVALAAGSTTLAALYSGTSAQLRDDLAAVSEGAELRADLVRPPAPRSASTLADPPPDLTELPEVSSAALVWVEDSARIGDVPVPLTLADTQALAAVANVPDGIPAGVVPSGLEELIATDGEQQQRTPIAVPPGAQELELTLSTERTADRWEIARLDDIVRVEEQLDEIAAEQGTDIPEGETEVPEAPPLAERVTQRLDGVVEAAAAPVPLRVSLLVEDVATGLSATVTSEFVQAPGPTLDYDPETLSDFTASPGTTQESVTFTLPAGREHTVEAVTVEVAADQPGQEQMFYEGSTSLGVDLRLRAGGEPILADGGWGSTGALSAEQVAPLVAAAEAVEDATYRTTVEPDQGFVGDEGTAFISSVETNEERIPTWYDTSAATWRVQWPEVRSGLAAEVVLAPGAEFSGAAVAGSLDGGPPEETPASGSVPVAITTEVASAADLAPGDPLTLSVAGGRLPAEVSAVVDALPGQRGTVAALADVRVVASLLAEQQRSLPWPDQVWADASGDPAAAVSALAQRQDLRAVTGPGSVSVTDATSAARLVFWVASAGAVLLALTGVAAVAATLLSARRPEVAVLRALGMPPAAQARSRALELGGVVLLAVVFGLVAGWVVGTAVVPELATSTTAPGRLRLPAALRLESTPWAVLLGTTLVGLLALLAVLARRVRAQALDRDYREEIR